MKALINKVKTFDVRGIISISLITTLNIVIIKEIHLESDLFVLFSNLITMVMTYLFTKRKDVKDE